MGAPKKGDWREARRRQAWELKQQGWKQKDIARALGVSEGAVSQWLSRAERLGEEALASHPPEGPRPKLTAEQKEQIPTLLAQGAEVHGFRGNVWTTRRIVEVIERQFGVRYHKDHVRKILHEMGLSYQQPLERATQRDEERIASWVGTRWVEIKKAEAEGYTIVFVDEAGFYLLPMAVGTWAPVGATPLLHVKLTRDHISAISGVTGDGRLFLQVRQTAYDAAAVVAFLRVLLRKIPGKILIELIQTFRKGLDTGQPNGLWRSSSGKRVKLNWLGAHQPKISATMCVNP